MNSYSSDRLDLPLFSHDTKLRLLEQQLYGHVLAAIDLAKLNQLDTSLFGILVDGGMSDVLALDVSQQLVGRALVRLAHDVEMRFCDVGPPFGISEAEKRAVDFDETCRLCVEDRQLERQRSAAGDDPHDVHEDEPCPCCEDLARSWREEHAEVLASVPKVGGGRAKV